MRYKKVYDNVDRNSAGTDDDPQNWAITLHQRMNQQIRNDERITC